MNSKAVNRLKKAAVIAIALLLAITIGVAIFAGVSNKIFSIRASYIQTINIELREDAAVKNTILMIGDGMGAQHLETAKGFYNLDKLYMETMEIDGLVTTYSKTGVTDSAAAATALSTGVKIHNGGISMDMGKNLETMSEYAQKHGKSVGIITTEALSGATPSGFSAHASNRAMSSVITKSQLKSGIDLFMGAEQSKYASYQYEIEAAGYDYVASYSDLSNSSDKIFAAFNKISTSEGTDNEPELKEIVAFAIEYLESKSDKGYFLMVEGAHIDKKSHSNDMSAMLKELKAFDEAIETVVESVSDDTFVMVTADHETGDLQYNGEKGDKINDSLFNSGGHTIKEVRYFATSHITNLPSKMDNTNIASIFRQLIAG